MLIDVDGQMQLVVFGGDRVDRHGPGQRRQLWKPSAQDRLGAEHQHAGLGARQTNCCFISSAYGTGSRVLEVRQAGGKTTVTEKWAQQPDAGAHRDGDPVRRPRLRIERRLRPRVHFGGGHEHRDRSPGRTAPSRARSCCYADGKIIVLDEDGTLGLATVSPQGPESAGAGAGAAATSRGRRRRWPGRRSTCAIEGPSPRSTSVDLSRVRYSRTRGGSQRVCDRQAVGVAGHLRPR